MSNSAHVSSRGFGALAGALYASALLLYDLRLESAVKALPWILSGGCCAVLDTSVSFPYTHVMSLKLVVFVAL